MSINNLNSFNTNCRTNNSLLSTNIESVMNSLNNVNYCIVKTSSEDKDEAVKYLEYNGYGKVNRFPNSDLYLCVEFTKIPKDLDDVKFIYCSAKFGGDKERVNKRTFLCIVRGQSIYSLETSSELNEKDLNDVKRLFGKSFNIYTDNEEIGEIIDRVDLIQEISKYLDVNTCIRLNELLKRYCDRTILIAHKYFVLKSSIGEQWSLQLACDLTTEDFNSIRKLITKNLGVSVIDESVGDEVSLDDLIKLVSLDTSLDDCLTINSILKKYII